MDFNYTFVLMPAAPQLTGKNVRELGVKGKALENLDAAVKSGSSFDQKPIENYKTKKIRRNILLYQGT